MTDDAPPPLDRARFRGALLGLAAGDALGTTIEFKPPGSFEPIDDLVGGGPFRLAAGQWTDDTSMALCLAESLVKTGGFDLADQLRRYVSWWREGHLSSTGRCFDIGVATRAALRRFEETGDPADAPSATVSALVEAGHLGRKTGRGFYTYDDTGSRLAAADLTDLPPKGSL